MFDVCCTFCVRLVQYLSTQQTFKCILSDVAISHNYQMPFFRLPTHQSEMILKIQHLLQMFTNVSDNVRLLRTCVNKLLIKYLLRLCICIELLVKIEILRKRGRDWNISGVNFTNQMAHRANVPVHRVCSNQFHQQNFTYTQLEVTINF